MENWRLFRELNRSIRDASSSAHSLAVRPRVVSVLSLPELAEIAIANGCRRSVCLSLVSVARFSIHLGVFFVLLLLFLLPYDDRFLSSCWCFSFCIFSHSLLPSVSLFYTQRSERGVPFFGSQHHHERGSRSVQGRWCEVPQEASESGFPWFHGLHFLNGRNFLAALCLTERGIVFLCGWKITIEAGTLGPAV